MPKMPPTPDWMLQNVMDVQEQQRQSTQMDDELQVDAGYDDDCCNEILQLYLSSVSTKDEWGILHTKLADFLTNMDCETLLNTIGNVSVDSHNPNHSYREYSHEISNPEKTLNDVYQECVAGKMPQGGDFTMGEPIDLAWRLLKHG